MRITYFNARLREGGDHALILLISERVKFQSTPPRRRRRYVGSNPTYPVSFQSTPPRRRRRECYVTGRGNNGFQSTPPRRRRRTKNRRFADERNFFNPRLREGGDCYRILQLLQMQNFQSTPPRRRRHATKPDTYMSISFSIHASAKEATSRQKAAT